MFALPNCDWELWERLNSRVISFADETGISLLDEGNKFKKCAFAISNWASENNMKFTADDQLEINPTPLIP